MTPTLTLVPTFFPNLKQTSPAGTDEKSPKPVLFTSCNLFSITKTFKICSTCPGLTPPGKTSLPKVLVHSRIASRVAIFFREISFKQTSDRASMSCVSSLPSVYHSPPVISLEGSNSMAINTFLASFGCSQLP
ncbi:hypothetical protein V8G54_028761 [Vigna mungo]|uniref:Uncharacterized protein n=1 Tax=Vigna mungo TaxID=3915 RepID=A0AAQ3RLZ7_VIGMU